MSSATFKSDLRKEAADMLSRSPHEVSARLGGLSRRERFVVDSRLGLGGRKILMLWEIGKMLRVSSSRVGIIERDALLKIRRNASQSRKRDMQEESFYVMAALYDGPKHSYGIEKRIMDMTGDLHFSSHLGTTQSVTLKYLEREGMVRRIQYRNATDEGRYELTEKGSRTFKMESARIAMLAKAFREAVHAMPDSGR